jgi:hypothetical protein
MVKEKKIVQKLSDCFLTDKYTDICQLNINETPHFFFLVRCCSAPFIERVDGVCLSYQIWFSQMRVESSSSSGFLLAVEAVAVLERVPYSIWFHSTSPVMIAMNAALEDVYKKVLNTYRLLSCM